MIDPIEAPAVSCDGCIASRRTDRQWWGVNAYTTDLGALAGIVAAHVADTGHKTRLDSAGRKQSVATVAVEIALSHAGFAKGKRASGGGYSGWGAGYEPPSAGFIVEARARADDWDAKVLTVTHAGKGGPAALPKYVDALRAVGFVCDLRVFDPLVDRKPRIVIDKVDLALYRAAGFSGAWY